MLVNSDRHFRFYDLLMAACYCRNKAFQHRKVFTMRTIGSTIFGDAADSLIFCPIAFYGVWTNEQLVSVMIGNYFVKVFREVWAKTLTFIIVNFLKRAEREDFYDKNSDFNSFILKT